MPRSSLETVMTGGTYEEALRVSVVPIGDGPFEPLPLGLGARGDDDARASGLSDVVLLYAVDLSMKEVREAVATQLRRQPIRPVLLLTSPAPHSTIHLGSLPAPHVVWTGSTGGEILQALLAVADAGIFRTLALRLEATVPSPFTWLTKRAVTYLCCQDVDSERPFIRSVSQLADYLGCSRSYLSRQAGSSGLSLSVLARWTTFLKGAAVRRADGVPWAAVSSVLDFPSPSAWGSFVRNLTGVPCSAAERRPLPEWVAIAAAQCLRGDKRATEVVRAAGGHR